MVELANDEYKIDAWDLIITCRASFKNWNKTLIIVFGDCLDFIHRLTCSLKKYMKFLNIKNKLTNSNKKILKYFYFIIIKNLNLKY